MRKDSRLETVLELCRDPVLAVEKGKIVFANTAAHMMLPALFSASAGADRLPDSILFEPSERFVASVTVAGKQFTVSGAFFDETRVLFLVRQAGAERSGLLSDGLITGLRSTLFNVGLAMNRVSSLTERVGDPQLEEAIAIQRHNYYTLRRNIDNLRTAVQLRDNSVYFAPMQTDLAAQCDRLAITVDAMTHGAHAALEFSTPQTELNACVDWRLVERMLLNLLVNSLAHTPPEGEIHLRLARSGGNAVLSVDDNGEGIPAEVQQNVFARYETRLDAAHLDRAASGGLGLGIASGIARLHGGVLIIESREGKGTSVRAKLPLDQPQAQRLECRGTEDEYGMDSILTELSVVLDHSFYGPSYSD